MTVLPEVQVKPSCTQTKIFRGLADGLGQNLPCHHLGPEFKHLMVRKKKYAMGYTFVEKKIIYVKNVTVFGVLTVSLDRSWWVELMDDLPVWKPVLRIRKRFFYLVLDAGFFSIRIRIQVKEHIFFKAITKFRNFHFQQKKKEGTGTVGTGTYLPILLKGICPR